jgi:hypothetical protein
MSSTPEIRPFRGGMAKRQSPTCGGASPRHAFLARSSSQIGHRGAQPATIQELARSWATEYDWRAYKARLNALPRFTTEIDGVDIHFIHVKSRHENALPLIITHRWPGSLIERQLLSQLQALGIDYGDVASVLENDGLAAFDTSWQELGDQLAAQLSERAARKESRA